MAQPIKILEIEGKDWIGGISVQQSYPVGGIFKRLNNYDPFRFIGIFNGGNTATVVNTSSTVAGVIQHYVGYDSAGTPFFYGFADATRVYSVNSTTNDVTNESAKISDITTIRGATRFKDRIIYASSTRVVAGSIPLLLANETTILTSMTATAHIMVTGPDRNLYITNGSKIARITSVTGTSGNSTSYLSFEDGVVTRDMASVGSHLAIIGDENEPTATAAGQHRCFVAFWNMKSQDLTRIWEFKDSALVAIRNLDSGLIIWGRDNIYKCTIDSPPVPLAGFLSATNDTFSSLNPTTPQKVFTAGAGRVIWGQGTKILGYGRAYPQQNPVFMSVQTTDGVNTPGNIASVVKVSAKTWAATDGAGGKLWQFTGGGSRMATATIGGITFKQPYQFAFAKVVLDRPLASGQSVALQMMSANENRTVLAKTTASFATEGTVTSHIFYPNVSTATTSTGLFEENSSIQLENDGAFVRRLEVWAYPAHPAQRVKND